jgi:hypothetical protein
VSYQPDPTGTGQAPPPPLDLPHYGIGFVDAVKRGFKKYATFKGRASRSEYWWWTLFTFCHLPGARPADVCRRHENLT